MTGNILFTPSLQSYKNILAALVLEAVEEQFISMGRNKKKKQGEANTYPYQWIDNLLGLF
jgi:hypothetical protein